MVGSLKLDLEGSVHTLPFHSKTRSSRLSTSVWLCFDSFMHSETIPHVAKTVRSLSKRTKGLRAHRWTVENPPTSARPFLRSLPPSRTSARPVPLLGTGAARRSFWAQRWEVGSAPAALQSSKRARQQHHGSAGACGSCSSWWFRSEHTGWRRHKRRTERVAPGRTHTGRVVMC